jgi:hypothetical protein
LMRLISNDSSLSDYFSAAGEQLDDQ